MKTNRKLKLMNDKEAVSPVIGVILMVAITVVLAGVVFLLVNRLTTSDADKNATLSLNQGMGASNSVQYSIITVDGITNYTQLSISGNGVGVTYTHTGDGIPGAGDIITISGLTPNTAYELNFVVGNSVVSQQSYHS